MNWLYNRGMTEFTHITDEGKRYNIREDDGSGDEIRVYEKGNVYNMTQSKPMGRILDKSSAVVMQKAMISKKDEEIEQGMIFAVNMFLEAQERPVITTKEEAMGVIVAMQTMLSLDVVTNPRESTNASKFVAHMSKMEPNEGNQGEISIEDADGNKLKAQTKGDILELLAIIRDNQR